MEQPNTVLIENRLEKTKSESDEFTTRFQKTLDEIWDRIAGVPGEDRQDRQAARRAERAVRAARRQLRSVRRSLGLPVGGDDRSSDGSDGSDAEVLDAVDATDSEPGDAAPPGPLAGGPAAQSSSDEDERAGRGPRALSRAWRRLMEKVMQLIQDGLYRFPQVRAFLLDFRSDQPTIQAALDRAADDDAVPRLVQRCRSALERYTRVAKRADPARTAEALQQLQRLMDALRAHADAHPDAASVLSDAEAATDAALEHSKAEREAERRQLRQHVDRQQEAILGVRREAASLAGAVDRRAARQLERARREADAAVQAARERSNGTSRHSGSE